MSYASKIKTLIELDEGNDPFKPSKERDEIHRLDSEASLKVKEIVGRWEEGLLSCLEMTDALFLVMYED